MTNRIKRNNQETKTPLLRVLSLAVMTVAFLVMAVPALAAPAPTFAPPENYPVEQTPIDVTSADFDGDGDIDLATANRFGGGNDDVTVFKNNGFGIYDTGTDYLGGVSAFSIDTGDF